MSTLLGTLKLMYIYESHNLNAMLMKMWPQGPVKLVNFILIDLFLYVFI